MTQRKFSEREKEEMSISAFDAHYIMLMYRIRKYVEDTRARIAELDEQLDNKTKRLGVKEREDIEEAKTILKQNIAQIRFAGLFDEYIDRA